MCRSKLLSDKVIAHAHFMYLKSDLPQSLFIHLSKYLIQFSEKKKIINRKFLSINSCINHAYS